MTVNVVAAVGRYGSPIVTAYADDLDLHLELIRQGWAAAYRQYLPDELRTEYIVAEDKARENGLGIWRGEFVEPRLWRRGERLPCER